MLNPLGVLSLQLACQLLLPSNSTSIANGNSTCTPVIKPAEEIPEGYTSFPDIGLAYKYYESSTSWNKARKYCETEGGNLAVIDSFKKLQYATEIGLGTSAAWVGIHRFFGDAEFMSVNNGFLATPLPWRSATQLATASWYCMAVIADSDMGLYVQGCTTSKNYICEVPIFKEKYLAVTECL